MSEVLSSRAWTDGEWLALKPPGFAYMGYQGCFGADGRAQPQAFAGPAPAGFVNVYAAASIMEDKAETYFAMRAQPDWLEEAIKKDRRLQPKSI